MNNNGMSGSQFSGGIVVPLINRQHYDFSYLSAGCTETITLAAAANVVMATSALLVVRIHVNNVGDGASISLKCFPTAPSREDPAEFSAETPDLSAVVTNQDAPFYLSTPLSTPPNGAWWKIDLIGHQHSSAPVTVFCAAECVSRASPWLVPLTGSRPPAPDRSSWMPAFQSICSVLWSSILRRQGGCQAVRAVVAEAAARTK